MGISTTAAIIGSAVIGGGAALASGAMASNAADNASSAQTASNDKALALQQQQFDTTQAEYAPWRTVGAGALQMLARTMGVKVPTDTFSYYNLPTANDGSTTTNVGAGAGTGATGPQQLTPGISAGQAYLNANPDVQAEYNRLLPTIDWNSPWAAQHGFVQGDPGAFGLWHYQNNGQAEGRAAPTAVAATYAPAAAATPANANGAPANNTLTTAGTSGPQAYDANGLPITNTPGKPTGLIPGSTAPGPAGADPRYGDFYASPDYQFRVDQGKAAVTGNYAAKGLIDSGALGKGLIDYGQKAGSDEFGAWYNRIASLAGVGQTAVQGSTAAGQANANAQSGILQSTGASEASSIATQGGINAGLIQNLGGTASGLINNLAKPSQPNLTLAPNQAPNANASNLLQPPSQSYGGGLYGPVI